MFGIYEGSKANKVKRNSFELDENGLTKYDRTLLKAEATQKRYFENQVSRGLVRVMLWVPATCRQEMIDFATNLRLMHKESQEFTNAYIKRPKIRHKDDGDMTGLEGLEG